MCRRNPHQTFTSALTVALTVALTAGLTLLLAYCYVYLIHVGAAIAYWIPRPHTCRYCHSFVYSPSVLSTSGLRAQAAHDILGAAIGVKRTPPTVHTALVD